MFYTLPISPKYRNAIFEGLALQPALVAVSALALVFGHSLHICGMALVAFWAGAVVLVWRRRNNPKRLDLSFIRVGYVPVCFIVTIMAPAIWRLRGVG